VKLDDLLREVARSSIRSTSDRAIALKATIRGCRAVEGALLEALGQEPLRGLPDIGVTQIRVYAARLRTKANKPLPHPNDPVRGNDRYLAIDPHGRLTLYWWEDGELCEAAAEDDDFRVGDLDALIRVMGTVLPHHLRRTERTSAGYLRAKTLSERLEGALGRS